MEFCATLRIGFKAELREYSADVRPGLSRCADVVAMSREFPFKGVVAIAFAAGVEVDVTDLNGEMAEVGNRSWLGYGLPTQM